MNIQMASALQLLQKQQMAAPGLMLHLNQESWIVLLQTTLNAKSNQDPSSDITLNRDQGLLL